MQLWVFIFGPFAVATTLECTCYGQYLNAIMCLLNTNHAHTTRQRFTLRVHHTKANATNNDNFVAWIVYKLWVVKRRKTDGRRLLLFVIINGFDWRWREGRWLCQCSPFSRLFNSVTHVTWNVINGAQNTDKTIQSEPRNKMIQKLFRIHDLEKYCKAIVFFIHLWLLFLVRSYMHVRSPNLLSAKPL